MIYRGILDKGPASIKNLYGSKYGIEWRKVF
jgi:hypothetical protein